MNDNKFMYEKMYRVCDQFVRHKNSSTHFGKSKFSIHIDNNQPFSVGKVKITVNEAEIVVPKHVPNIYSRNDVKKKKIYR